MQPIQFFAARAEDGVLLPGATVRVFISGTQILAALFSNVDASVPQVNPLKADGNARVFFYTKVERIDIQISYGGYSAPLLREIHTLDAADVITAEIDRLRLEMTDGKIHSSEAAGRAAVLDGAFFYAASNDPRYTRTLWKRINSSTSQSYGSDINALTFPVSTGEFDATDYSLVFVDKLKRLLLGIKKSGAVALGDVGDLLSFVKGTAENSFQTLDFSPDYSVSWTDKLNQIALGIHRSGKVTVGAIEDLGGYITTLASNTFQTLDFSSDFILSWNDRLKKVALAIYKSGNIFVGGNLVLQGEILAAEGRTDNRLERGFMDGGHPARTHIVCIGDSMTNGYAGGSEAYPKQLADKLPGRSISNLGVSSNTSIQIAARMGAAPARFSVVGGVIPRAGVVSLTASETPSNLSTNSMDLEFDGTLFGVPGKLKVGAGAGTTSPTFTRSCAGDVVAVPSNTPFVIQDIGFFRDSVLVIWAGRNNNANASVLPYIAAMVAQLSHSRFIVLSVCTRTTEVSGTSGYTYVNGLNAQLKSIYPNNYVDVLTPLIAAYNPALPDDVTAHAGNTIPPSLSTDGTHLTAPAQTIVAQTVADSISLRGF